MTRPSDIKISVDLLNASTIQLDFLKEVSKFPDLQAGPVLTQAVHRYVNLWLPLAAKHDTETLAAPLDIQWAWHCHMLCPVKYNEDCMNIVGKTVNSKLFSPDELKRVYAKTQKYWSEAYPDHPLEVGQTVVDQRYTVLPKTAYDIAEASSRQKVFYYQVSLPHFKDQKFLKNAQLRYKKFLFLKLNKPNLFLVPCYDIDLMWHTHQLHPVEYQNDTISLLGRVFNHDDTVNDRSEGSKLYNADLETRSVWKSFYYENFSMYGAMYRGDPPQGNLYMMSMDDTFSACTKSSDVILESIQITSMPPTVKNFRLKILLASEQEQRTVAILKGPKTSWNNLKKFTFDTGLVNNLSFRLNEKTGFLCMGSSVSLGDNAIDMLPYGESTPQRINVNLLLNDSINLRIVGSIQATQFGACTLQLVSGGFERCVMPENIESMWGPVPLPKLPSGADNVCEVASHTLKSHSAQPVFTARVIHSLPLMMSVVHVFFKDKLSVVAHLVGSDQLPLPSLVSDSNKSAITVNPRTGEKAVLIKNHAGDWGVVIGKWDGLRKGVPGVKGTKKQGRKKGKRGIPGIPGSPGTLKIKFKRIMDGSWQEFKMPYLSQKFDFEMKNLRDDLFRGLLTCTPSENGELAEHIGLTFSIALLHVLCQTRPAGWKPGQSMKPISLVVLSLYQPVLQKIWHLSWLLASL